MRIAIAQWHHRISPVFDVSDTLCLIESENGREGTRESVTLTHRDPFGRAREIAGRGVEVLICGAISRPFETALINAGVQVAGFLRGNLDAVIAAFLGGHLTDGRFFMPGCHGEHHRHRFCGRRGRR